MSERRTVPEAEQRRQEEADSPTDLSKPSLLAVVKRARTEFKKDRLTDLAAALTYYGVLSIVPALIVPISVLGRSGRRCRSASAAPSSP